MSFFHPLKSGSDRKPERKVRITSIYKTIVISENESERDPESRDKYPGLDS